MTLRLVRHVVVTPVLTALILLVLLISPVLLVIGGILALVVDREHWRQPRALLMLVTYAAHDVLLVLAGLGLWLRLGGGGDMAGAAMQRRHYQLIAWMARHLGRAAEILLALHVDVDGTEQAESALRDMDRPLIVLSRHAGPGDSMLVARELIRRGRQPRIVLRAALQVDPCFDVIGNRIPFCFIRRSGGDSEQTRDRIAALSAGMTSQDALLLFPEGGNVTPERRRRAIRHLLKRGWRRQARQAAEMEHVTAPKPGGTLAAIAGNPLADVIFITHSGLMGMDAPLWRRVPVDLTLRIHMWRVPASDIPAGEDARVEWLFGWWKRVDDWVDATVSADAQSSTGA